MTPADADQTIEFVRWKAAFDDAVPVFNQENDPVAVRRVLAEKGHDPRVVATVVDGLLRDKLVLEGADAVPARKWVGTAIFAAGTALWIGNWLKLTSVPDVLGFVVMAMGLFVFYW